MLQIAKSVAPNKIAMAAAVIACATSPSGPKRVVVCRRSTKYVDTQKAAAIVKTTAPIQFSAVNKAGASLLACSFIAAMSMPGIGVLGEWGE